MTRVVFAPDSFKGTVRAADAARLLAEGWRRFDPCVEAILRPMADGGEGTLDAFTDAIAGAVSIPVEVSAPAPGRARISTRWVRLPSDPEAPEGTGVVELAATSGIEWFGEDLDPWHATTYGFGEAIVSALDAGVSRLILAIGSSASTDGGAGMLSALGVRFVGAGRQELGCAELSAVSSVDVSRMRRLPPQGAIVLTDVRSPLLGPSGAVATFGRQKGFTDEDLPRAESAIAHYAALIDADAARPGAGAAGGTGFALASWGARSRPGAGAVAEMIGLSAAIAEADLVVTGEGMFDAQSALEKAPIQVAREAEALGVSAAIVAGVIAPGAESMFFDTAVSMTELAGSSELARRDAHEWLRRAGERLAEIHAP